MRHSNRPVLVFDLDDTLIDTSAVFALMRREFSELMSSQHFPADEAIRLYDAIDETNLQTLGYASERNLISMRQTYERLVRESDGVFSARVLQDIARIGSHCLYSVPRPFPQSRSFLNWCARRYTLALVTRGSEALQRAKLEKLHMVRHFAAVRVVREKSAATFLEVLSSLECQPANAISIGDSLRFDILPSVSIGMSAIHIPYFQAGTQWKHDSVFVPDHASLKYKTATNFVEARALLAT